MEISGNTAKSGPGPLEIKAIVKPGPKRRMSGAVREHVVDMDLSKRNGGDAAAPSPPEYLALALAGCLVSVCRFIAEEKGVELEGLEVSAAGAIDPEKAMGMTTDGRTGFINLSVTVQFEADMTVEQKKSFIEEVRERCPLCDTISNMTDISFNLL